MQVTAFQFRNPVYIYNVLYILNCFRSFASTFYYTVFRLPIDVWPWKTFQQCPRTWWIFVSSFIEVSSLSNEILRHTEYVLTHNGRTDRPEYIMPVVGGTVKISPCYHAPQSNKCILDVLPIRIELLYTVSQKTAPFYCCNNFVKRSSILIMFGILILQWIWNKTISKSLMYLQYLETQPAYIISLTDVNYVTKA